MDRKEFAEVAVVKRVMNNKGYFYTAPKEVNEIIEKILNPVPDKQT